jgi:hypothetical protein
MFDGLGSDGGSGPRPQAAREVREARRLLTMPATRAAFPAGERTLVDHARDLRFDDWQRLVEHCLAAADPDGPEPKRQRDHDLRRFAIPVGLDGIGHPDGYLTPLATETVTEARDRIERDLFHTDWTDARAIHGDNTTHAHLARTPAQRRHDATTPRRHDATTPSSRWPYAPPPPPPTAHAPPRW